MLPEIAHRTSSSDGRGVVGEQRRAGQHHARRAEAALQPVLLLERRLDRMELPACSSPSTVVTSRPSACTPNIVHDFTGWPSSSTVQAPQLVVSQPTCVPGEPELLADQVREEQPGLDVGTAVGAVDLDRDLHRSPFIPQAARAISSALASPRSHVDVDDVALVVGGAADVADRARKPRRPTLPASANAASVGSAPARLASASVGRRFFDPTAVSRCPRARSCRPRARGGSPSRRWRNRRPCVRASGTCRRMGRPAAAPGPRSGSRRARAPS